MQTHFFNFCGCGNPNSSLEFIRDILIIIKEHGAYSDELSKKLSDEGLLYFVLYYLDSKGLTEHGGSVGGSWITEKGEEIIQDINWCLENEKDN